ncbi:hypothetical protein [Leptolyngbya sp. FACHB-16]|uniref:hypothetical protein n=1 Tax=unclassified Leptolyngbya TaxID=2650499 RepID=UPI001688A15C|nr:hypothetical protein [Leptolyngbya sp. FACHB-16]MBD2156030.1 hypothetical protein [Leptolyngbya sp. FACHB-16]
MNIAQIRKTLAEKGIRATASQIKKAAQSLGLTGEDWAVADAQRLMDELAESRTQSPSERPRSANDGEYSDSCDRSELAITQELQRHALTLHQERAAIATGLTNAAESFSDDLVEMVTQFKPLVYTRTAEKLRALRQRDTGHSIAAAFSESFDALATSHPDIRLLPDAMGHAR